MFDILIGSALYGKQESQTLHAYMLMNMHLRILWNCLIMLMRQKGSSRLDKSKVDVFAPDEISTVLFRSHMWGSEQK